jgi:antitoxin VapB
MPLARVFKSGNSQAVRLPKEFRFESREVDIFRRGDEIILRERQSGLGRAFELLAGLPDDGAERLDPPPQSRDGSTLPMAHQ